MKVRFICSSIALILLTIAMTSATGCNSGGSSSGTTSTTTTLAASTTTPTADASVTLTATVSPSAATGTVTFYDGTASLGTGTLSSGTATLATSFSTTGTHTITATYGGSTTYATSTSSAITVTVSSSSTSLTATATTLTSSSSSATAGISFTLTGTVAVASTGDTATAATGSVEFYDTTTSTILGTVTPTSGVATLTTSLSTAGTHEIEAIFAGDSTYATSTSSTIPIVVSASSSSSTTTVTLSVSPTTITYGTGVGLAAIVTPLTSTGTVSFYDGSTEIGTASLVSGSAVAALTTTSLAVGSHTITAQYNSVTSSSTSVQVNSATSGSFTSNKSCGYTKDGATGAYVLSSGTLIPSSGSSYSTSTADQNAICVTGTSSYLTLIDPTITSSAVTSSDGDSSWYGLDAAVLDYNGGVLTMDGGTVTTSGDGGNMVFSYGTGTITISNATLTSTTTNTSNNHGIYAAGAGTIVANNVTASSAGSASSIVATDNGGGTLTINGGSYKATGNKSAGIYSTGVIKGYNATFTSTGGEAVVIEGDNSVVLSNSTLNSASSGTHRGIFLYQSMSGDATNNSCGTSGDCFEMTNGTFNYTDTTSGNTDPASNCTAFEVYNQTSLVTLTDVTINNSCGTLLLAGYNDQWSNSDAWGYVTFKVYGTTLTGNIIVGDTCLSSACTSRDTSSTAAIYLYEDTSNVGSTLTGAINNADTGKTVSLTMDKASKWVVTGTSYLTSLTDADTTYSNITCQTTGCTVYVNGTAIAIND
jgi:hypothetical protein